jgi:hypothetical protein
MSETLVPTPDPVDSPWSPNSPEEIQNSELQQATEPDPDQADPSGDEA